MMLAYGAWFFCLKFIVQIPMMLTMEINESQNNDPIFSRAISLLSVYVAALIILVNMMVMLLK
jgi:hypothetical protein